MNNLQYLLLIFIYIALGTPLLILGLNSPVIEDLTQFKSKHGKFDFASFMNLNSKAVMVTKIGSIQHLICSATNSSPPTSFDDIWNNFKTLSKHDQNKIWKLLGNSGSKSKQDFINFLNTSAGFFMDAAGGFFGSRLACVKNYHQFKFIYIN